MTSLRYDPELRAFNFAKLVTLAVLATLFGVLLAMNVQRLKPVLNTAAVQAAAGAELTLDGTGKPGEPVQVLANGELLGETRVDSEGMWQATVTAPETVGPYAIQLIQGQDGEWVEYRGALVVSEDVMMEETEAAAAEEAVSAETASDAESESIRYVVSPNPSEAPAAFADGVEQMSGTAPANARVLLLLDDVVAASTTANADGYWEQLLEIDRPGSYDFTVAIADDSGKLVGTSESVRVVHYAAPTLDVDPDMMVEAGKLVLSGQAEPNTLVGIEAYGEFVGETQANAAGNWTWSGTLPVDDEYRLRVAMLSQDGEPLVFSDEMTVALPQQAEAMADAESVSAEAETNTDTAAPAATEEQGEVEVAESAAATEEAAETTETTSAEATDEAATEAAADDAVEVVLPDVLIENLKLPDALASDGRFNTLYAALDLTGNVFTLKLDDPFTMFAPTDAAFGKLPERVLTGLQNNPNALRRILLHHLVPGVVRSGDLPVGETVFAAGGMELVVASAEEGLTVSGVPVAKPDVMVKNGIIHEVESVILPPSDFAATTIDASGVATFTGRDLTVTGTAEPGAIVLVELNGNPYGTARTDADGNWSIPGTVEPGQFVILAYALDGSDVLQTVSTPVQLTVTE